MHLILIQADHFDLYYKCLLNLHMALKVARSLVGHMIITCTVCRRYLCYGYNNLPKTSRNVHFSF